MKIIFLDIDGVLNSDEYFDKIKNLNINGIENKPEIGKYSDDIGDIQEKLKS